MITVEYACTLTVTHPQGDREAIRAEVDRVMQELLLIEQSAVAITNAAISLDLDTSTVIVELVSGGPNFAAAQRTAESSLRAAIHAAGGSTPGWEWTEVGKTLGVEDLQDA